MWKSKLEQNLPTLSQDVNRATYGRATQWFAFSLLAKLYLNAEVYTGVPQWADCIAACDAILNSGKYVLEEDFFKNFAVNNEDSRENIFVIPFDFSKEMLSLGCRSLLCIITAEQPLDLQVGGVNGFCSTAEYLASSGQRHPKKDVPGRATVCRPDRRRGSFTVRQSKSAQPLNF